MTRSDDRGADDGGADDHCVDDTLRVMTVPDDAARWLSLRRVGLLLVHD